MYIHIALVRMPISTLHVDLLLVALTILLNPYNPIHSYMFVMGLFLVEMSFTDPHGGLNGITITDYLVALGHPLPDIFN